jgi:hypothetical protein
MQPERKEERKMKTQSWMMILGREIVGVFLTFVLISSAAAEIAPNRAAIVIDRSDSFKSRQSEAVDRVVSLLENMAQTKLHRWESETDQISIISLDAMPDVIWEGSLQALKATDPKEWKARFLSRSDLALCTDVKAGFELAVRHLEGAGNSNKYLFVFSDLIHEPPTTSVRRCEKASGFPSQDFPWDSLRDVSVSVFWVPPDQKLIWRKTAEEHGFGTTFALYTTSESFSVKTIPPPRPTLKVSEKEKKAQRERIVNSAKGIGTWVTIVLLGVMFLPLVMVFMRKARSRRNPQFVRPSPEMGSRRQQIMNRSASPLLPRGPR